MRKRKRRFLRVDDSHNHLPGRLKLFRRQRLILPSLGRSHLQILRGKKPQRRLQNRFRRSAYPMT
jgi:hypothetical protein